jgi:hypothetical protein
MRSDMSWRVALAARSPSRSEPGAITRNSSTLKGDPQMTTRIDELLGKFLLAIWLVIRSRYISLAATPERSRS